MSGKTWIDSLEGSDDTIPCDSCGIPHDLDALTRTKVGKDFKLLCPSCITEREEKERQKREAARKARVERPVQPVVPSINIDAIMQKIDAVASSMITKDDMETFMSRVEGMMNKAPQLSPSDDIMVMQSLSVTSVMQLFLFSSMSGTIATFEDGKKWGASNKTKFMNLVFNLWMQGHLLKNIRCRFVINPGIDKAMLSRLMGRDLSDDEHATLVQRSRDRVREATKGYEFVDFSSLPGNRKQNYIQTYKDDESVAEIQATINPS